MQNTFQLNEVYKGIYIDRNENETQVDVKVVGESKLKRAENIEKTFFLVKVEGVPHLKGREFQLEYYPDWKKAGVKSWNNISNTNEFEQITMFPKDSNSLINWQELEDIYPSTLLMKAAIEEMIEEHGFDFTIIKQKNSYQLKFFRNEPRSIINVEPEIIATKYGFNKSFKIHYSDGEYGANMLAERGSDVGNILYLLLN